MVGAATTGGWVVDASTGGTDVVGAATTGGWVVDASTGGTDVGKEGTTVVTMLGGGAMGLSSTRRTMRAANAPATRTARTNRSGVGGPPRRPDRGASSSKTVRGPTATTDGAGGRRSGREAPTPRSSRVTIGLGPVGASPLRCQNSPPSAGANERSTPAGPWAANAATARSSSRTTGTGTLARAAASPRVASSAPTSGRTTISSSGTASTIRTQRACAVTSTLTSPGPSVGDGAGRSARPSPSERTSIRPSTDTAACTEEPPRCSERTVGIEEIGRFGRRKASSATLRPTGTQPPPSPAHGKPIGGRDAVRPWHPFRRWTFAS